MFDHVVNFFSNYLCLFQKLCELVKVYYVFLILFLVVEKAGQNMQHTMIASYIAILLGYITMDNKVMNTIIEH